MAVRSASSQDAGAPPSGPAGGDLSGTFPNPTVVGLNGTSLAGLATGLLKNTTGTGVPTIAVANTDYLPVASPTFTGTLSGPVASFSTSVQMGSGAAGLLIQAYTGGSNFALYSTNVTPSTTNYTLAGSSTSSLLNSPAGGATRLAVGNTAIIVCTSSGTANTGTITTTGAISPNANAATDLGTTALKWRQLFIDQTLTGSGNTGNQTINKAAGSVRIAATGTSVTVTNSLVSTSSIVLGTISTNDTTATLKNIVPGSGSFVITLGAAATAETEIRWLVVNQ